VTGDDRHSGRGMLALPLAPDLALCTCCHWLASGPDVGRRAAAHRDETSHFVVASRAERDHGDHEPTPGI